MNYLNTLFGIFNKNIVLVTLQDEFQPSTALHWAARSECRQAAQGLAELIHWEDEYHHLDHQQDEVELDELDTARI